MAPKQKSNNRSGGKPGKIRLREILPECALVAVLPALVYVLADAPWPRGEPVSAGALEAAHRVAAGPVVAARAGVHGALVLVKAGAAFFWENTFYILGENTITKLNVFPSPVASRTYPSGHSHLYPPSTLTHLPPPPAPHTRSGPSMAHSSRSRPPSPRPTPWGHSSRNSRLPCLNNFLNISFPFDLSLPFHLPYLGHLWQFVPHAAARVQQQSRRVEFDGRGLRQYLPKTTEVPSLT